MLKVHTELYGYVFMEAFTRQNEAKMQNNCFLNLQTILGSPIYKASLYIFAINLPDLVKNIQ